MGRNSLTLLPSLQNRLDALGENVRLARLRRQITTEQLSERAGITRPTLLRIERGDPNVAVGAYANVLLCLGLEADLDSVALDDTLGRKLLDARMTVPRRRVRSRSALAKATIPRPAVSIVDLGLRTADELE